MSKLNMDETQAGQLYCILDKHGQNIDCLLDLHCVLGLWCLFFQLRQASVDWPPAALISPCGGPRSFSPAWLLFPPAFSAYQQWECRTKIYMHQCENISKHSTFIQVQLPQFVHYRTVGLRQTHGHVLKLLISACMQNVRNCWFSWNMYHFLCIRLSIL